MKHALLQSLVHIPRLLGLIDRNKGSHTYGCFDRMFWNYKKTDFPSGMAQLGVLPLALIYTHKFPGNRWHKNERIKELCQAGIDFMKRSSHSDGTTDEFYPFERALGATSFTLYAATEAYLLLGDKKPDQVKFFKKRADWLCKNTEPSVIANHQANAALALVNVYKITGDKKYLEASQKKITQVFAWACDEGWFFEYEGCDPGYLTFTIDFLAKYYEKTKDQKLLKPLKKSVEFCSYFFHPDNSYAGEYGSRNTFHYMPHGFEILGKNIPLALELNNRFTDGLSKGKAEAMEDDVYFFLTVTNYLQAYITWNAKRPRRWTATKDFTKYFPEAKLYIQKRGKLHIFASLAKGGVAKIFKAEKLVYNDSGFIAKTKGGKTATSQVIEKRTVKIEDNHISCSGNFHYTKNKVSSPWLQIAFRLFTLTIGRSNSLGKLVKERLIKKLITNKKKAPIEYERNISFDKGIVITDTIKLKRGVQLAALTKGSGFSFITVPSSRYYQESVLHPWVDLADRLPELNKKRSITIIHEVR